MTCPKCFSANTMTITDWRRCNACDHSWQPTKECCSVCGDRLMFSARQRGDGLCGPHSRDKAGPSFEVRGEFGAQQARDVMDFGIKLADMRRNGYATMPSEYIAGIVTAAGEMLVKLGDDVEELWKAERVGSVKTTISNEEKPSHALGQEGAIPPPTQQQKISWTFATMGQPVRAAHATASCAADEREKRLRDLARLAAQFLAGGKSQPYHDDTAVRIAGGLVDAVDLIGTRRSEWGESPLPWIREQIKKTSEERLARLEERVIELLKASDKLSEKIEVQRPEILEYQSRAISAIEQRMDDQREEILHTVADRFDVVEEKIKSVTPPRPGSWLADIERRTSAAETRIESLSSIDVADAHARIHKLDEQTERMAKREAEFSHGLEQRIERLEGAAFGATSVVMGIPHNICRVCQLPICAHGLSCIAWPCRFGGVIGPGGHAEQAAHRAKAMPGWRYATGSEFTAGEGWEQNIEPGEWRRRV